MSRIFTKRSPARGTSRRRYISPLPWLVVFVVLAGILAALLLGIASRMPSDSAYLWATDRLIAQGTELTRYLSGMPLLRSTNRTALIWLRLPYLVDGLHRAQSGLQYVEISRDGTTLFHRQTGKAMAMQPGDRTQAEPSDGKKNAVQVTRQWVERYGEKIPVYVFRREIEQPDGSRLSVEVGMRREAIEEQERVSARAIRQMLNLSLGIMLLAFALCLAAMIWAIRRERRLERRRRQEEHLVFTGLIANSIVHDFRNPMSAVRLDAQMLARVAERCRNDPNSKRIVDLAQRIGRTLERMDAVFKEFLFTSRPATATVGRFDLKRCAAECIETLTPRFEQVKQRVVLEAPPAVAKVDASEPAMRRALINVLYNAIQHAPQNSVIELRLRADKEDWVLDVCDRGPGIPPKERKAVFEMFASSRPGGTGLGLFLARAALHNCGGSIEALGRKGGGAIIRMRLPMSRDDETAQAPT